MARCQLCELDGIGSIAPSLKELYLANNEISDISSIGMLEYLEILDLEGNAIDDLEQIEQLALCPALASLTLQGNPVTGGPLTSEDDGETGEEEGENISMVFRMTVWGILPKLCTLDDEELARSRVQRGNSAGSSSKSKKNAPKRPVTSVGHYFNAKYGILDESEDFGSSDLTFGETTGFKTFPARLKRCI
ncbi:hypothetical protein BC830DRAFT_1096204 [Chytriomyces sp. MP71]|nr:hypothetical protein BC830DRAFT_1096204 [Chytriomyces sp. MP71]